MVYTGKMDESEMNFEILVFLRNLNVLSAATRGVTNQPAELFSGAPPLVNFQLANTNVKNVRSITVGGVPQVFGEDYHVDYEGTNPGRITFNVAPPLAVDNISVNYDYGNLDKIYYDFPRVDLNLKGYPRIAVNVYKNDGKACGIGGTHHIATWFVRIRAYAEKIQDIRNYITTMRNAFLVNNMSFYYFQFIEPVDSTDLRVENQRSDEVEGKTLLLRIPLQVETI